MTDHTTILASCGHAFGGPTYLVQRPDDHVVLRIIFTPADASVPLHPTDEPIGVGPVDGQILVTTQDPSMRRAAYGAKTLDQTERRAFAYHGDRNEHEGRSCPVWRLVA